MEVRSFVPKRFCVHDKPGICYLVLIKYPSCIAAKVATAQAGIAARFISTMDILNGRIKSMMPVTLFAIV